MKPQKVTHEPAVEERETKSRKQTASVVRIQSEKARKAVDRSDDEIDLVVFRCRD